MAIEEMGNGGSSTSWGVVIFSLILFFIFIGWDNRCTANCKWHRTCRSYQHSNYCGRSASGYQFPDTGSRT